MRLSQCFALALLAVSVAPASARDSVPAATDSLMAAYAQLARAYENADDASLRALLTPNFDFEYVLGTNEDLSQYISDWKETRQNSPGVHVTIHVVSLTVRSDVADAKILLTQSYPRSTHAVVDIQREDDRWALQNGSWALARAETIKDTVSVDGNVVSSDGPPNPLSTSERQAVVTQLRTAAWPIETAVPGGRARRDLDPLYDAIGSARIVGMGEATHGTSEFFSLKDRIFRFLVEKMGFTLFAMETPWRSALAIDRYVTTGKGDSRAALAGTFAVWENQEVLDLIEWMRAYNITRGNRPELRFVGIDMQDDPVAIRDMLLRFIKATRPADLDVAAQRLSCLNVHQTTSASCLAAIAAVGEMIKGEAQTTTLPRADVLQAEHAAMVALEIAEMRSDSDIIDQTNSRDHSMAHNVDWFATAMFPRARIAVWAHDGHVMTSSTYGMIPMGTYLRQRYGTSYYVIGFAFDRGSVSPNGINAPVMVAPAPPPAVGAVLSSVGEPLFGINLRSISAHTALGAYLSSEQPMRTLGAFSSASDLSPSQSFGYVTLKRSFDWLIFVKTMHPAHAFEPQRRHLTRSVALPAGAGGITWPTRWLLVGSDPSQYNTGGDAPSSTYPSGLLWLSSASGLGNGVTVGTIPVTAYLGKQIQLSGELRTFQVDEGASAWLRVDGANKPVSFDNMADRMLRGTTTWTPFSITLNVPADSRDIAFGLLLRGQGWLWATNLRVKGVEGAPN